MTGGWSHPAFEQVTRIVSVQTGLSFESGRRRDAEAGIRRAMEQAGVPEVVRYLELLQTGELPLDDLVTELTVGETYFFREPAHFAFIRHEIFPDVLRRRGSEHTLRMWSAGCATGEEAYSLSLLLEEAGLSGHVLATDISRAALRGAREATYRPWSLRDLDDALVRRFFRRAGPAESGPYECGNRWALDARLRSRVTFEFHNLAQSAYPSLPSGSWSMDLILCRNVLIYFDKTSVGRVARGLYDSLADDGWLLTGPSDPLLDGLAPFTTVITEAGVVYRKGGGARHVFVPAGERGQASPPVDTVAGIGFRADVGSGDETGPPAPDPFPRFSLPRGTEAQRRRGQLDEEFLGASVSPDFAAASGKRCSVDVKSALAEARQAFAAGEYERVLELTHDAEDGAAAVLHVRALANSRGSEQAAREAQRQIKRHSLFAELHLLQAVLLLDAGCDEEATRALRRVLYLDRSLVIANLLLGSVLRRQGKLDEARRAYRNVRDLARTRPPDETLPFADGERAAHVVEVAEAEMALLDARRGRAGEWGEWGT